VDIPAARQILDVHDVRTHGETPGDRLQITLEIDGSYVGAAVVLSRRLQTVADAVGLRHGKTSWLLGVLFNYIGSGARVTA
jgi:hypothetical protein